MALNWTSLRNGLGGLGLFIAGLIAGQAPTPTLPLPAPSQGSIPTVFTPASFHMSAPETRGATSEAPEDARAHAFGLYRTLLMTRKGMSALEADTKLAAAKLNLGLLPEGYDSCTAFLDPDGTRQTYVRLVMTDKARWGQ